MSGRESRWLISPPGGQAEGWYHQVGKDIHTRYVVCARKDLPTLIEMMEAVTREISKRYARNLRGDKAWREMTAEKYKDLLENARAAGMYDKVHDIATARMQALARGHVPAQELMQMPEPPAMPEPALLDRKDAPWRF